MPTFEYAPITRTTYRVIDAHTREVYGAVREWDDSYWVETAPGYPDWAHAYATRDDASHALYHARHALGFEVGAL